MEEIWSEAERLAAANYAQALQKIGRLPSEVSVERFVRAATDIGPLDHYKHMPEPAMNMFALVKAAQGVEGARAFLRATLGHSVCSFVRNETYKTLPPLVARQHGLQLLRIANDLDAAADWLDISEDRFQKEFGLVTLRLYAAGAQLVDFRCGVPRSIVFRQGLLKAPRKLGLMMGMGGFKPYFQIHTHVFNLDAFNEEGWNDCYRCCAELYSIHPECLGMFGSSWFYDPALDSISPRLAYLRTVPIAGGAHLMYVADGGEAISNATSTSASRRKLYEEGKYMPKSYMLIWARDQQIRWAKAHPGSIDEQDRDLAYSTSTA